jgi:predicted HTH transcriptional regulator
MMECGILECCKKYGIGKKASFSYTLSEKGKLFLAQSDQQSKIELFNQPESDVLVFIPYVKNPEQIAMNLVALANTKGGKLILGVKEGGEILGIKDISEAQISHEIKKTEPPLKVQIETVNIKGKQVIIIGTPGGYVVPYSIDGKIFQRAGKNISTFSSESLYTFITEKAKTPDDLKVGIKHLLNIIGNLSIKIEKAQSWKSKIKDYIYGSIIGAVITGIINILW